MGLTAGDIYIYIVDIFVVVFSSKTGKKVQYCCMRKLLRESSSSSGLL